MNATRAECLPRTSATETNGDTCDVKLLGMFWFLVRGFQWLTPCSAQMGYKQELRRQYSTLQVFAVAFSIMESVPSIASTLAFRFLRVRSAWFGRVHKASLTVQEIDRDYLGMVQC